MPLCYNSFSCGGGRVPFENLPKAELNPADIGEYLEFAVPLFSEYLDTLRDVQRANSGESEQCLERLADIRLPEEVSNSSAIALAYEARLYFTLTNEQASMPERPIDAIDLLTMRCLLKDFPEWPAIAKQEALQLSQNDAEIHDKVVQHFNKYFKFQESEDLTEEL